MKYKIGDSVKIIKSNRWTSYTLKAFNKLSDSTATITEAWLNGENMPRYEFREIHHIWREDEIECLVEQKVIEVDRFALMDFD